MSLTSADRGQLPDILFLEDIAPSDLSRAGGKGAQLATLTQSGYPIPKGFVIGPNFFVGDHLCPEAEPKVRGAFDCLARMSGAAKVAVRSSALNEDGLHASFAGGYETILNVSDYQGLLQALVKVRQSLRNGRVEVYSAAMGGVAGEPDMAVIVQVMVPADWAGVLFTANPVDANRNTMIGNLVDGLGEQLVSGETNGESFELDRPHGSYQGPTYFAPFAAQLFELANRLEQEFGGPQDIEWAVADGHVYILQTRPITTLQDYQPGKGEWNTSHCGRYLWTNTSYSEAVPDVMTPITWSLMRMYVTSTSNHDWLGHHPIAGNINGRFYVNLSVLFSIEVAKGHTVEQTREQLSFFLGHIPKSIDVPLIALDPVQLAEELKALDGQQSSWLTNTLLQLDSFLERHTTREEELDQAIAEADNVASLQALWRETLSPFLLESFQMASATSQYIQSISFELEAGLRQLVEEPMVQSLISACSQGEKRLASLLPLLSLSKVFDGTVTESYYRKQFGHRCAHEYELSRPRPAEEPDWVTQTLGTLTKTSAEIESMMARIRSQSDAAWDTFSERLSDQPEIIEKARVGLDALASSSRAREIVRDELAKTLWLVRKWALRLGSLSGLDQDVFFLTLEELDELKSPGAHEEAKVELRKASFEEMSQLPPYPNYIRGRFDARVWAANPGRRSDYAGEGEQEDDLTNIADGSLVGFPASAGIVEGRVRVLKRPEEGHEFRDGEILVTTTTNVGWTFIFAKAAAVITDVGAPLSHAAIVARELGIPAVIGCGNATSVLKTGDRVRIHGGKGMVEFLDEFTL